MRHDFVKNNLSRHCFMKSPFDSNSKKFVKKHDVARHRNLYFLATEREHERKNNNF